MNPQPQGGQAKRISFNAYQGGNASVLLERAKAGIRRSTPDSEALASSDDEQEQHHHVHSVVSSTASRPARRSSWLSEVQHAPQRKASLSGSGGGFSPVPSHPATPAADQSPWSAGLGISSGSVGGRGSSNSASFPWGNAIWGNDTQQGTRMRLNEMMPSPTSLVPPGSAGLYIDEPLGSPGRESANNSSIPFAIPLHPTPKTYRSQSYSVGQLDPEASNQNIANIGPPGFNGRTRTGTSYTGLQHRPSRPSMLGDLSHDPSILGQLREVEDDEESSSESEHNMQKVKATQARTIEQLALENAILRQAAAQQLEQKRLKSLAASDSISAEAHNNRYLSYQIQDKNPRSATADAVYAQESNTQHTGVRKDISEHDGFANGPSTISGLVESQKLESIKKGHWQSSLGFGGVVEAPHSRRHSFADVPTRHGSIGSIEEIQSGLLTTLEAQSATVNTIAHGAVSSSRFDRELGRFHSRIIAAASSPNTGRFLRIPDLYPSSVSPSSFRPTPLPSNQYLRSSHPSQLQQQQGQILYMITFKACRAEVYYVPEGTGLQIRTGDLVIVEADRGTDLGTVAHENITLAAARELKEHYAGEHYKWLMMFSRHGQDGYKTSQNLNVICGNAGDSQHSTTAGAGAQGHPGSPDVSTDLKPKLIKRLAQSHEVQILREKEGNEAKAKRLCQQKVVEHRLNMEILDAEFQVDWKKLTFYYFADSYINFNTLVTDLFKIYKTRIWMSAINPASFVTPNAGLQVTSGPNMGMSSEPGQFTDARVNKSSSRAHRGVPTQPGLTSFPRWEFEQAPASHGPALANGYAQPYSRPADLYQANLNLSEYGRNSQRPIGSHLTFNSHDHTLSELSRSPFAASMGNHGTQRQTGVNEHDWSSAIQGLSLDS